MSKSVKIVFGGRRNRTTVTERLNKTARQIGEERSKRQRLLAGTLLMSRRFSQFIGRSTQLRGSRYIFSKWVKCRIVRRCHGR